MDSTTSGGVPERGVRGWWSRSSTASALAVVLAIFGIISGVRDAHEWPIPRWIWQAICLVAIYALLLRLEHKLYRTAQSVTAAESRLKALEKVASEPTKPQGRPLVDLFGVLWSLPESKALDSKNVPYCPWCHQRGLDTRITNISREERHGRYLLSCGNPSHHDGAFHVRIGEREFLQAQTTDEVANVIARRSGKPAPGTSPLGATRIV